MQRAIELAKLGLGYASPNPLVGCVIVHHSKIIGEGYHKTFGEAHAEVNAVQSVEDKSLLAESTAYVTLEPCAHHGKTPPCADMLVSYGVKRVVIGGLDPFEKVNGEGVRKLREGGVDVVHGILEKECREMNTRFLTSIEQKRPYVILKWAQTKNGFLARGNYDSKWISNTKSRQLVHKWRSEEDAILVGFNTAKYDNPSLTVRDWKGRNPVRVVVDDQLALSNDLHLYDGSVKTFVLNTQKDAVSANVIYIKYDGTVWDLLNRLVASNIQSLIVEGGTNTLKSFIDTELWDEARVFTSNQNFESGIVSPKISGVVLEDLMIESDRLEILKHS